MNTNESSERGFCFGKKVYISEIEKKGMKNEKKEDKEEKPNKLYYGDNLEVTCHALKNDFTR